VKINSKTYRIECMNNKEIKNYNEIWVEMGNGNQNESTIINEEEQENESTNEEQETINESSINEEDDVLLIKEKDTSKQSENFAKLIVQDVDRVNAKANQRKSTSTLNNKTTSTPNEIKEEVKLITDNQNTINEKNNKENNKINEEKQDIIITSPKKQTNLCNTTNNLITTSTPNTTITTFTSTRTPKGKYSLDMLNMDEVISILSLSEEQWKLNIKISDQKEKYEYKKYLLYRLVKSDMEEEKLKYQVAITSTDKTITNYYKLKDYLTETGTIIPALIHGEGYNNFILSFVSTTEKEEFINKLPQKLQLKNKTP